MMRSNIAVVMNFQIVAFILLKNAAHISNKRAEERANIWFCVDYNSDEC